MIGCVENEARRESRQQRVDRLHAEGCSVAEIAARLHIRNAQVANDLRNRRVAPAPPPKVTALPEGIDWMGLHLATLQEVQRQAWRQWEASKAPRETRTVVERVTEHGTTITRTIRTAESHGEIKFLNLILRTLKDQARLHDKLTPKPKPDRQPRVRKAAKKPTANEAGFDHFREESTAPQASRKPLDEVLGRLSSLVTAGR